MNTEVIDKIAAFLQTIGLELIFRPINGPTFLPGLLLENGKIIADREKMLYPGDMLHEAGHLAAYTSDVRATMSDPLPDVPGGDEMMAMAWSYAACLHIGLDPKIVFHDGGYKGGGDSILQAFLTGSYIGLPMLQYLGMAYDKKRAEELNTLPYPTMVHWLKPN